MPHGSDQFLLQLLVIFVWAKIFGEFFEQIRLPAVLGEILAGVILGPYATAFVLPDPRVESIASLGAIFLLFSVGLETSPAELLGVGRRSMGVAISGIVFPFALGFGFMMLNDRPAHEATFVGAAMVATSVGITARVLGDMNVLHTRAAKIILAAAVFDDVLGMIVLALVAGLAASGGIQWVQVGILIVEALGFVAVMIFVAPRVIGRMRPGLQRMSSHNAPLILALAICLGLSVAAEKVGMAAIIGAFFAGFAFSEYAPEWKLRPGVNGITEFFAPFFFFIMGAKLNLGVINKDVALLATVISLLAIVSKLVGCGLPVLREGWRIALKVGVGMTPRGEVGLIVALAGLSINMISESSYAVIMLMTASTTLFAPPILRVLFHEDRSVSPQPAAGAVAPSQPQGF